MGKRKSPRSNRGVYKLKIGTNTVVSKLKISTGDYLGLKRESDLVKGKRSREITGAKGTKSFQLVFKKAFTLDGVRVQTLSFPVSEKVTVMAFYSYAKKNFSGKGVGAIITPDGIQKAWDKIERSKSGLSLPGLPSLPSLPGLDLSGLLPDGTLSALGSYLGGEFGPLGSAAGSAIGGYLDGYI